MMPMRGIFLKSCGERDIEQENRLPYGGPEVDICYMKRSKQMNEKQIRDVLTKPETKEGIRRYVEIMDMFPHTDVSSDTNFQRRYNGFYRMRQRPAEFYKEYYLFLESHKNKPVAFEDVLKHLDKRLNRVEPSFSSKLVHTINPDMPIWDTRVLKHLQLKAPSYSVARSRKIERDIDLYKTIESWYNAFFQSPDSQKILTIFDEVYPKTTITRTKKIDFVLWQIR
jgi:hypothetical protein